VRRAGRPARRLRAGAPAAAAGPVAAAALALALAGCGEDRGLADSTRTEATPERPPPLPQAVIAVSEREYALDPGGARLDRPAAVEVHVSNDGRRRHALALRGPAGVARTEVLAPGGQAVLRIQLARPGRYRWWCPVDRHARRGMRGTVVVAPRP
jgi:plastocyanin